MTREEIKKILPDVSDDALKQILDINGRDTTAAKGNADKYKSDLDATKADLVKANNTIKELEEKKGNADALQAEIDKYKKAEQDRKAAEAAAAEAKALAARFDGLVPEDRKFINEFTKNGILSEFKDALAKDENKGKGDKEIFDALIKDREGIFANPNSFDIPGVGGGNAKEIDDDAVRAIMGLPSLKK